MGAALISARFTATSAAAVANNDGDSNSSRRLRQGQIKACALMLTMVLSFSILLSGCGKSPTDTPNNVVVLASATANEPAPEIAQGERSLLYRVGADSTDGTTFVVNPNTGQPTTVSLTPRRPDGEVEYAEPRRDQLLSANVNQVQAVLGREAAAGGFDLLADIAAAVRVISESGTLIVISSGLSVSGAFNLIDVGWGASPEAVAAQLRSRGMIPRMPGWRVVFSGLGNVEPPQPELPLPERTTLAAYWMAICHASGAASCQVDETTRPEPLSRSTALVPVVPIPAVTSVQGPHGWSGNSVPADEFFDFGSARLLPGADAILSPLAAKAIAHNLLVSISGYASPDGGSEAYNQALSTVRAEAVRARLISLGVSAAQIVRATGFGTAGKTRGACSRNGHIDEAVCAQLRRVMILLSPDPAASA